MEYESDRFVVALVRVQQLSQSVATTFATPKSLSGMPLSIIVQTFEHEIARLWESANLFFAGHGEI